MCNNKSFFLNFRPSSADLLGSGGSGPGVPDSDNVMTIPITKGGMGFGFTIADSQFGQKVKKILDRPRYVRNIGLNLSNIGQKWTKINFEGLICTKMSNQTFENWPKHNFGTFCKSKMSKNWVLANFQWSDLNFCTNQTFANWPKPNFGPLASQKCDKKKLWTKMYHFFFAGAKTSKRVTSS